MIKKKFNIFNWCNEGYAGEKTKQQDDTSMFWTSIIISFFTIMPVVCLYIITFKFILTQRLYSCFIRLYRVFLEMFFK